MVVWELLPARGLLLHEHVAPLGRVLAVVREGARRGRGRGGPPAQRRGRARREARLVLRRRRAHLLLLGPQHLLLLLLQHLRLLLSRYPSCSDACGVKKAVTKMLTLS